MSLMYNEKRKNRSSSDLDSSCAPATKKQMVPKIDGVVATLFGLSESIPHIDLMRKDNIIVGRSRKCDILLQGADISTKHCTFSLIEVATGSSKREYFHITDVSSNGTFVNGEKLDRNKNYLLKTGDKVEFAQSRAYIFRYLADISKQSTNRSFFDEYILGKQLGAGHYAVVKEAKNKLTGETFAVKIFHPNKSSKANDEKLDQEMNLLISINHPNIVKFISTFVEPTNKHSVTNYLVLEKINSGELFQRIIDKKKLRQDETKAIFKQLLRGLHYLHEKNIIHRDIKPENVLLNIVHRTDPNEKQKGPWDHNEIDVEVKIADFGLAKFIGELKFTNTLCGTPAYVAPEILINTNRKYSKSVDLWSAGTLLYVCLVGFPPFSEELGPPSMKEQILRGKYAFFSPYFDEISDSALDLISRLLVVNPSERLNIGQTCKHPWFNEVRNETILPIKIPNHRNEGYARVAVRSDTQPITLTEKYTSESSSGKKQYMSYDDSQGLSAGINLSDMSMEVV